jgi:putative effector of murein hydrolase LrgA (UPF0299 family)
MPPIFPRKAQILIGCLTVATFVAFGLSIYPSRPLLGIALLLLALLRIVVLVKQIRRR